MAVSNKRIRRQLSSSANQHHWPWWQLDLANESNALKGRERVLLSRHIINLRPISAGQSAKQIVSSKLDSELDQTAINFISLIKPEAYSLTNFLKRIIIGRPRLRDLSVVFVLEIVTAILDLIWLSFFIFFIRLYEESRLINRSIWFDVINFSRAVYTVLAWPFKFYSRGKIDQPPKVRRNTFVSLQPKIILAQTGVFLALILAVILPLKGIATWQNLNWQGHEAINLAQSGFLGLEQAGSLLAQGDPVLAEAQLSQAKDYFSQAQVIVDEVDHNLAGLLNQLPIVGDKLTAAKLILSASQEITMAASIVARTLTNLDQISSEAAFSFGPSLHALNLAAADLKPHLAAATKYLSLVDATDLPSSYQASLTLVREQLNELESNLTAVLSLPQLLGQLLNTPEPKTYAILFQNTTELRPTGGFAGSLALIEVSMGEIRSVNIPGGGPYDYQGSLARVIRPPEPLRLVRETWQLQDANWFYDFPSSAQKIMWFLKESGGPTTDGVAALNSDVVVDLLRITGPIELPQYGKVLTADNFLRETQAAVEIEYDREQNRPKQFIADLAPLLFAKLLELKGDDLINLSALINTSLLNKGLQFYSTNPLVQEQFEEFGWAGQIQSTAADYLAIVRTNIGGGKTDGVIREQVKHQVEISPTGELIVHLTIKRTHTGDERDTFEGRRNVSYLRFYVPAGSTLLATQGFTPPLSSYYRQVPTSAETDADLAALERELKIDTSSNTRVTTEFAKTVFANWLSVAPGETKSAEITYRLPFRLSAGATWQDLRRYSILFQRQSGVKPIDFISEISWPEDFRLRWQETSQPPVISDHSLEMHSDWQTDEYYGIILEKK